MNAAEPTFKIVINGKDATKDLTPYLLGITYVDNLSGKADELRVDIDNTDWRFLNDWFLSTGMIVECWINQMYCGKFTIDECSESAPPHQANFRAQSAEYNSPIRTKRSFTHQKKTLADIVKKYADDHQLKIVGTIPDLNLENMVQMRESDIDFLHRIAHRYGCICSIKGGHLIFEDMENLWKKAAVKKLGLSDMISYHFCTTLADSADAAAVSYQDAKADDVKQVVVKNDEVTYTTAHNFHDTQGGATKDKLFSKFSQEVHSINNPDANLYTSLDSDYNSPTNIAKVVHVKAESKAEAKQIAKGELIRCKNRKHRCTVTVPGNELMVASNAVQLTEVGKRSGYWLIEKSTHKIGRKGNGYTTTIEIIHGLQLKGGSKTPVYSKKNAEVNRKGGKYIDDVGSNSGYNGLKLFGQGLK